MPRQMSLPRGCATIRGATDVRNDRALGGQTAKHANRLYMLTVRRESLLSKQQSLEHRLKDIRIERSGLEKELRQTNQWYRSHLKASSGKKRGGGGDTNGSDGDVVRTRSVALKF